MNFILSNLFSQFSQKMGGRMNVIQIGANDGVRFDPIHQFVKNQSHRCILVEPIQEYFEELKVNYKQSNSDITFVNKAISESNEKRIMHLPNPSFPLMEWQKGIASFREDFHRKGPAPTPDNYMVEREVECITFESLIEECNFEKVDVLVSDCEGYDLKLLKTYPFKKYPPRLISIECQSNVGVNTIEEVKDITSYLYDMDYKGLFTDGQHLTAWKST